MSLPDHFVMYGNLDVIDVGVSAHGDKVEACVRCL